MMDTPMLREKYRKLMLDTLPMMGPQATVSDFNDEAREFLRWTKLSPTPRNWVEAAESVHRQFLTLSVLEDEGDLMWRQEKNI